jgi:membrane protease subunit HflC
MFKDFYDEKGIKKSNVFKAIVVFVVVLIVYGIIAGSMVSVKENDYLVVRQFGEIKRVADQPGYTFVAPILYDKERITKSQQLYSVKTALINTADKKPTQIDSYAIWRISDPKMMIRSMKTITNAENRMSDKLYSLIRSEFGKLNYSQIIGSVKKQTDSSEKEDIVDGRSKLTKGIVDEVNKWLKEQKAGVEVLDVQVKRTDLPKENEASVFARMISEREAKAQEFISTGDAQNISIKADTDRQVTEKLAEAGKQAKLIRAEGEREAGKIYNKAYSQNPEFYSLYRTLESYKKTINGETVILLPADSPYAKVLTGK